MESVDFRQLVGYIRRDYLELLRRFMMAFHYKKKKRKSELIRFVGDVVLRETRDGAFDWRPRVGDVWHYTPVLRHYIVGTFLT